MEGGRREEDETLDGCTGMTLSAWIGGGDSG